MDPRLRGGDEEYLKIMVDYKPLTDQIKTWAAELGFQDLKITDTDLSHEAVGLKAFLEKGYHGEMDYLEKHAALRTHPEKLVPGTVRVLVARMNYLPPSTDMNKVRRDPKKAYIARYALGEDYHKILRKKLAALIKKIKSEVGEHIARAFTDSAPVMEAALAAKAGLGWRGKNTLVLNENAGSYFFLGTIYTSLPLPVDNDVQKNQCGSCTACLQICPTQAFVAPYQLNASRCISYLTIELKGSIPVALRPLIKNRVYGCDDCQVCCPWNRFAKLTDEGRFHPKHNLDNSDLIDCFLWDEKIFTENTKNSPIGRIGFERWLRNMAVGLGNAPYDETIMNALQSRLDYPSALVKEHIEWALKEQQRKREAQQ
jgi:epoxyqueuosine reductase